MCTTDAYFRIPYAAQSKIEMAEKNAHANLAHVDYRLTACDILPPHRVLCEGERKILHALTSVFFASTRDRMRDILLVSDNRN